MCGGGWVGLEVIDLADPAGVLGPIGGDGNEVNRFGQVRGAERPDPGKHECADQVAGPGRVSEVHLTRRGNAVGEHYPGRPLRHPGGFLRIHPSDEEWGDETAGRGQKAVRLVECQPAEHDTVSYTHLRAHETR